MKELNEEIKITVEQMRGDIDDSTYSQLQSHLYKLLEMKRDMIRKQLAEYSQEEPDKLLAVEELKAGGWWCADTSAECAKVLEAKGLLVFNPSDWVHVDRWNNCGMDDDGVVNKSRFDYLELKQIYRDGNEFYWGEK